MLKKRQEYFTGLEDGNEKYCYAYTSGHRRRGAGPVRIGERMKVRDDLYSMLFITTLHAEYISYYDGEAADQEEATEKMLSNYRRERKRDHKNK